VAPYDHRYRLNHPPYNRTFHRNHEFIDEPGHITDLTAEEAVRWIHGDRVAPFFLYVPFHAVHVPLSEEPQWLAQNEHIQSVYRRLFAAAATHMDDAIGRIVDALDETNQRENTLIVFLSDNGGLDSHKGGKYPPPDPPLPELSSNVSWRGHKTELYEGGIRVPAFCVWPDRLAPSKIESPTHAIDWLPTLAKPVGVETEGNDQLDGQDIWPLLNGTKHDPPPRSLYWAVYEDRRWLAVRHGPWKIVKFRDRPWQLFDLENDPREATDVASQHPDTLQKLLAIYDREMRKDKLADDS